MIQHRIILFLSLSILFAVVHYLAVSASLYWYYWWFDILMHTWGGVLIALGVHSFSSFSFLRYKPSLVPLLLVLVVATGLWEVFEWSVGLYDPQTHVFDTSKDVILGFVGGLLMHFFLTLHSKSK
jgi:hypothetical protein